MHHLPLHRIGPIIMKFFHTNFLYEWTSSAITRNFDDQQQRLTETFVVLRNQQFRIQARNSQNSKKISLRETLKEEEFGPLWLKEVWPLN